MGRRDRSAFISSSSVAALVGFLVVSVATANGQTVDRSRMTGADLYGHACAACHGQSGKGQPRSIVGFDTPLPDFTDCGLTTPETDFDWSAVVHLGGRARALDRRMPSFAEALSDEEVDKIIHHIRGFCTEPKWPRGELNFPRPFFTEKAFPENEAVLTTTLARHPGGRVENEFLYEHRIGRRAQYEINVPIAMQRNAGSDWHSGLGDISAALKLAVYDSLARGTIVSAGAEVKLPTGKDTEGFGGGTTVFESFAMSGHTLPSNGFLQFHAGLEVPADAAFGSKEFFWRTAVGKSFFANRWGRAWSPMLELTAAKPIGVGEPAEWDLVPQLQVSLSGLQHVLINVGLRAPLTERDQRNKAVLVYLLWDWFDGGFFSNWRTRR